MRRDVLLLPPPRYPNERALSFWIDVDAGELGGRDADRVRDFFDSAMRAGSVAIEPHPNSHAVTDPYRTPADVAAIFAPYYILPSWLAEALPRGDPGDSDDPAWMRY